MSSDAQSAEVKSVALLAAWCENPNHLETPSVEEYLAEPQHQQLCNVILQNWSPCGSATTGINIEASSRRQPGQFTCPVCRGVPCCSNPCSCPTQEVTPAELSQRCVDLLLREYYKMVVAAQQKAPLPSPPGPGARLFLALCADLPWPLHLRVAAGAAGRSWQALAALTVCFSWLLVPAWCWGLRAQLGAEDTVAALCLAAGGLLWLLAAALTHQAAAAAKLASGRGCVTAATLEDVMPGPSFSSHHMRELFFARQPPVCVPVPEPGHQGSDVTAIITGSEGIKASSQGGQGLSGRKSAAGSRALADVVAEVQALQQAVFGADEVRPGSSWPQDVLISELLKLCSTVGLPWKPPAGPNAVSLAHLYQVVRDLKQNLGV